MHFFAAEALFFFAFLHFFFFFAGGGTGEPDGGGDGGVLSRTSSSAPMSMRATPLQSPSRTRGLPSTSRVPGGGGIVLPASTIGEPMVRWKLLMPVVGSTNIGAAAVWKFAQLDPVVGPREKVIVQTAGSTIPRSLIGSSTTLESRTRLVSASVISVPLPQAVMLRA